jgi:glycosyltransferase involved in cell wall biosynthesis
MHIAMITDGVSPMVIGGMQSYSANLARHLARAGATVDLLHPTPTPADGATDLLPAEKDRVKLHYIPWPMPRRYPGHYAVELREYSRHARRTVAELRPDWVYVQGLCGEAFVMNRAAGSPPVAVNLHGLEMFQPARGLRAALEHRLLRPLARRSARNADICISLGGRLTQLLESVGVSPSRIAEIPVGIDEEWITREPNHTSPRRRFVFVGRHERRKGLAELNDAARKLSATHQFDLEIVGPIPLDDRLDASGITYHGEVRDRETLRRIVSEADVLVCPSHAEGMPTVILEGMARGLAIIGTRVGAVEDLVGPDNGWLIEPADPHHLYWAMRSAIEAPEDRLLGMKRASIARISNKFTWTSIAEKTLRALEHGPSPDRSLTL